MPVMSPGQAVEIDPERIRVSRNALRRFVEKHREQTSYGPGSRAEPQIRRLLAAMLADPKTKRSESERGIVLRLDGYKLYICPDGTVVTNYWTVHAERTWEQVNAGVPSRFAAAKRARKLARRKERHLEEFAERTVEAGGTAELLHDGAVLLVIGPEGEFEIPKGSMLPAEERGDTYREAAEVTGLTALADHADAADDDPEENAGWLAVD